jgi:hypothetical protein
MVDNSPKSAKVEESPKLEESYKLYDGKELSLEIMQTISDSFFHAVNYSKFKVACYSKEDAE